jgi:molecular chaperone GrpE
MTDERLTDEQEQVEAAEASLSRRRLDEAGEAETPAQPASEQEMRERLSAAEARAEEHLNDLKRVAAEFENFRKRAARERAELLTLANERLAKELLPVLDDLGRALEAAEQHEEAAAEPPVRASEPVEGVRGNREVPQAVDREQFDRLAEGVRLVHRQLSQLLEKEGLSEIETEGAFDPHVHEALLSQPSDAEEGSVIEVLQKGYRLGERVLRPARVVVAAAKEDDDGDGQ